VLNGGFEWTSLQERSALEPLRNEGPVVFETKAGKKIECTEASGRAFATNLLTRGTPRWQFDGCRSEGLECHSNVAPILGEINNEYAYREAPSEPGQPVPGWIPHLGFIEKSTVSPIVGLSYKVKNLERLFEPIVCKGALGTVWLGGSKVGGNAFISHIAPLDEMSTTFTQTYAQSAPGVQSPTHFQFHSVEGLQAFLENHWEPVALTATFTFQVEEGEAPPLEIKALP
jgi:hypothetical protein